MYIVISWKGPQSFYLKMLSNLLQRWKTFSLSPKVKATHHIVADRLVGLVPAWY